MKRLVLTAAALVAMSPLALAAPTKMSDAQMDKVVAGQNTQGGGTCVLVACTQVSVDNNNIAVAVPVSAAVSVGVLSGPQVTGSSAGLALNQHH